MAVVEDQSVSRVGIYAQAWEIGEIAETPLPQGSIDWLDNLSSVTKTEISTSSGCQESEVLQGKSPDGREWKRIWEILLERSRDPNTEIVGLIPNDRWSHSGLVGVIGGISAALVSEIVLVGDPENAMWDPTPVSSSGFAIRLVSSEFQTREFRSFVLPGAKTQQIYSTEVVLRKFDDLKRWLNRGERYTAKISRISIRSLRYWSADNSIQPRAATVRRLFELHSLVGSLVEKAGEDATRNWFSTSTDNGKSRLDLLTHEDGVRLLIREASDILFAKPSPTTTDISYEEELEDQEFPPDDYVERVPKTNPRRPRRVLRGKLG